MRGSALSLRVWRHGGVMLTSQQRVTSPRGTHQPKLGPGTLQCRPAWDLHTKVVAAADQLFPAALSWVAHLCTFKEKLGRCSGK